jgi:hypothetical protein
MTDWSRVLSRGWPGAQWTLHDTSDLNTLEWDPNNSPPDAPTQQEIIDKAAELASTFAAEDFIKNIPPITRRQLILGLREAGVLSDEEAIAAAKSGDVPAAIQPFVAYLSAEDQVTFAVTWASMSVAERSDPLVAALGAANGWSDEQLNAFFISSAQL